MADGRSRSSSDGQSRIWKGGESTIIDLRIEAVLIVESRPVELESSTCLDWFSDYDRFAIGRFEDGSVKVVATWYSGYRPWHTGCQPPLTESDLVGLTQAEVDLLHEERRLRGVGVTLSKGVRKRMLKEFQRDMRRRG